MRIIDVVIENFMGIGSAHLALDEKGLVLLQGVNEDDPSQISNGAGKSSLADAIFWCLYGETARDGLAADEVVNRTVGKDTLVTCLVEDGSGSRWLIERWRKKGKHKPSACGLTYYDPSGTPTDLTKGTDKLTQVEIDKALGCSKDVFTAAVYAGQEKLPNLPAMSDGELKKLIEEASGVTLLIAAYDSARQKLKDAERDHDSWRADHARLEHEFHRTNERLDELKREKGSYEGRRKTDLATLKTQLQEAVTRCRAYKNEADKVNADAIQKQIDALDTRINAVNEEQETDRLLSNNLTAAKGQVANMERHYQQALTDAKRQRLAVDNITSRVGTPCGECGKPYAEHDLGDARKLATTKLRELVDRAKEIASDVETLKVAQTEAERKQAEHAGKRTDIAQTVAERQKLAEHLAERNRALEALERDKKLAQDMQERAKKLASDPNPFEAMVEKCEQELSETVAEHRKSEERGVELEKRVMVTKDVVKVFGPAGVRAHILDTVTPYLNDRTADYLGTLSDGRISAVWSTISINKAGELKENFAIRVEKEGAGGSFAALSGGEKRKVRLACALALQDLVASRATKPIGLWIGDEIDDALDDAGLERLMTVLEQKARERGTVLVISHNALNDWIRDTATVTMKGGLSTVSGCLEAA